MRRWLLMAGVAAGVTLAAVGAWAFSVPGPFQAPVSFQVYPGDGLKQVAWHLREQGLVRSADLTYLYARLAGSGALKPGVYRLEPGSPAALLAKIGSGEVEAVRLTIPEGWSLARTAKLADSKGLSGQKYLSAAVCTPELVKRYPFLATLGSDRTLEGYLFPDTYEVGIGSEQQLIERQLARFAEQILPLWQQRPANWPYTLDQTLTLASIVELEAVVATERPLIAGVFLQRLRIGMPLGSDPTVEYALKRHQTAAGLSFHDVKVDSPYNTYRRAGLPPTPIANPGLASFRSTLQATSTPYLYFVAKGDGTHTFTRSYGEHLQAGRRIRQGR